MGRVEAPGSSPAGEIPPWQEESHLGQGFSGGAGSRAITTHRGRQGIPGASLPASPARSSCERPANDFYDRFELQFSFTKEPWGPRIRASGTLPTLAWPA